MSSTEIARKGEKDSKTIGIAHTLHNSLLDHIFALLSRKESIQVRCMYSSLTSCATFIILFHSSTQMEEEIFKKKCSLN